MRCQPKRRKFLKTSKCAFQIMLTAIITMFVWYFLMCSLNTEQPDFNTMVQMEAGTSNGGSGILDRSAMTSPLSPDLLMAVDPREVNSGALLTFEENRKEKANGRGKSVVKNQDRTVVSENPSVLERYNDRLLLSLDTLS